MANKMSEIGTENDDMSSWDPDRTTEVPPSSGDPTVPVDTTASVETTVVAEPPAHPRGPATAQFRTPTPAPAQPTRVVIPPPATRPISPATNLPPRTEWLGTTTSQPEPPSGSPRLSGPVGSAGPFTSAPAASPPVLGGVATAPVEPAKSRVGWFWPAVAAFVLGGLMTGLGFRIGTQSNEISTPAVTTPISNTTSPPVIVRPSQEGTEDPAAFVAATLGPSVVTVETDRGLGSGVIFDDGLIMTNNHVIEGAGQIQIRLADGGLLDATLVGADPRVDIAVVSVGEGRNLPQAELALDSDLEVGQLAIAIGSPFQLQQTVTAGIISALNRPVQNGLGFTAMIQTDAPINPGNSGGALADRDGRVIGINTAIQTAGDTSNAGVGFAVPIKTAHNIAQRIISGQDLVGGFLGVGGGASIGGASGVEVANITADSAADFAGIEVGDRIVSVDGVPVVNLEQLAGIVSTRFPGDEVEIGLVRNGQNRVIIATLGER